MARIVVTTAGTTGDLVPFLALAGRLQERGHRVLVAVNPAMIASAQKAGLEAIPCGQPFGQDEARARAASFDETGQPTQTSLLESLRQLDLARVFRDLVAASRGADLLISSSLQGVAPWVHEATAIPWINATIFAAEFPHHDGPPPEQTEAEKDHWRTMFDHRNAVRREVGLPALPDDAWRDIYWSKRRVLIASSRHFSQPRLDDRPQARMTGFWYDDAEAETWTPGDPLASFLEAGDPPLVLTLSSLPVSDPARVVTLHAEAAAILEARLIIQQGWAGLDRSALPETGSIREDNLHFTGHAPHAWLFHQCSAVIQHGGIGTTAQALKRARPMLVEPYCNDQFFNGARVAALGVGTAVDHRQLTPANVAEVLSSYVLAEEARQRAARIAHEIAAEDGLNEACRLIEAELGA